MTGRWGATALALACLAIGAGDGLAQARRARPLRSRDVRPAHFALSGHDYLAAEGVDLDADGRGEILLVRSGALGLLRLSPDGRGVEVVASASVEAPDVPPLPRRPLALAARTAGGATVRASTWSAALDVDLVDGELVVAAGSICGPDYPLEDACAVLIRGRDYFAAQLAARDDGEAPRPASASFYARRVGQFTGASDGAVEVEALVAPSGRLLVRAGEHTASVLGAGAALALGDVDGDGEPELLTSVATDDGRRERLQLFRLRVADGRLTRVYRSPPLAGSVMVAGSADLDGDGESELFAIEEPATGDRATLWVLP